MVFSKKIFFLILPIVLLILSACASAKTPTPAPTATPTQPHWAYEGNDGPVHWGEIDPSYAACSTGKEQSPIDLTGAEQKDIANVVFHYDTSKVNIINTGHSIQVNYDKGSSIEVDGKAYDLIQFHFHAPSEHSINGKLADAELHLVHRSTDRKLAVVGILINKGPASSAIQSFWNNLPAQAGPLQKTDAQVNANDFLPSIQTTYRYEGSLTTPPCTEGVQWIVMTQPITFSEEQLATFTKLFEGSNRPVQALNGRTEVQDTTP